MNKNLKKTIALSMSAVMCFSMVACSKDKDKSKNNENNGDEYGYNVEFTNLDQINDYIDQISYRSGNTIYYNSYKWDENNNTSSLFVQSLDLSSTEEPVTYITYNDTATQTTNISCIKPDDDGNITFFKTVYTYSDSDGTIDAGGQQGASSIDIGDVPSSDLITEDYITQFNINLSDIGLEFNDVKDLTVGEFVDLYNGLTNSDSGNTSNADSVSCHFVTVNENGNEISAEDITEKIGTNTYFSTFACDKDGKYYMPSQFWSGDNPEAEPENTIIIFDPSTLDVETLDIELSVNNMVNTTDGTILATVYDDEGNNVFAEFDTEKKEFKDKTYSVSAYWIEEVYSGADDMIYYTCDGTLYSFDLSDGKDKEIMKMLDYNISSNEINDIFYEDETHFSILSIESTSENNISATLAKLTRVPIAEMKQSTVITLGCFYLDEAVKQSILAFNKTNTEYQIRTKEYMTDDMDSMDEAITNLNNDLTSGSAPDLIDCSSIDFTKYESKGLFENLSTYMENDSEISGLNLDTHILDLFKSNGNLYMLPAKYTINLLASSTSLLGENAEQILTIDTFADLISANGDKEVMEFATRDSILSQLYQYNASHFVNYADGTCNFTDGQFEKILTIANTFPTEDELNYEDSDSTPTKLANGSLLFYPTSLYSFDDYVVAQKMLSDRCNYTSYPAVTGGTGLSISPAGALFAISSTSKYKDQCWDFIKTFFLNSSAPENMHFSGLPVDTDILNTLLEDAQTPDTYIDENGEEQISYSTYSWDDVTFDITPLTDADVTAIKEIIAATDSVSMPYVTSEITSILTEEAQSFFNGEKSAADVCAVIQSRAEILINESK